MQTKTKTPKNTGYSLVELIIYISILTLIIVIIVNTTISFTTSYRRLIALRTVEHSAEDAMERMTRDIRGAKTVDNAKSTLGTSPGILTIISTISGVSTTTKFYLQNGILKLDINGTYFGPLSLSNASTTSLIFRDLSSGISHAIKIDMAVTATSGPITTTKTFHSTIILRGQ